MPAIAYPGSELALFRKARNWKAYLSRILRPFVAGRVLEVGAGIGATTEALCDGSSPSWLCLEPDPSLHLVLERRIASGELPPCCECACGEVADLPPGWEFETAIYIDVLEHIEDDRGELERSSARIVPSGRLIVVAPAHGWLYSPFDGAIGHRRRYSRKSLLALTPAGMEPEASLYLDSVGLAASVANRFVLRQEMPRPGQIALWDGLLVRASAIADRLTGHALGKSVLAVWRRPAPAPTSPSRPSPPAALLRGA